MNVEAALGYAARGWHVFPLRPWDKRPAFPDHPAPAGAPEPGVVDGGAVGGVVDGGCRRDVRCTRAGRHVTWAERATTDPDRITRAWSTQTRRGPYGIGIACGPSGLLVVDLDVPKPDKRTGAPYAFPQSWQRPGIVDGADVLSVLADRAGAPDPATLGTWTARTPSGGVHLYFTPPPAGGTGSGPGGGPGGGTGGSVWGNTTGDLGPLVDTRGAGGYVAAAPTTLRVPMPGLAGLQARGYVVDDPGAQVLPLPAWIAELLAEVLAARRAQPPAPAAMPLRHNTSNGSGRAGRSAGSAGPDERAARYVAAAVDKTVQAVLDAPPRQRNRTLYGRAASLGQLVAGGALDADTARSALLAAGIAVGQSQREAAATIASGMRAGAANPRTVPTGPTASTRQGTGTRTATTGAVAGRAPGTAAAAHPMPHPAPDPTAGPTTYPTTQTTQGSAA